MRRTALALTVISLALPSSALAQSAGDDQYQDPFAGQGTGTGTGTTTGSGTSGSGTSGSGTAGTGTTGATPGTSGTAGTSGADTTAAGTSGSGGNLPYTGYDSIFSGVAGLVLLLAGVTVRASVRDRRR